MHITRDIRATNGNEDTNVAFKNCAPDDEQTDTADNFDITMPMYNLIEYSENYSDTSGSLWQFKRDEQNMNNNGNPDNVTTAD